MLTQAAKPFAALQALLEQLLTALQGPDPVRAMLPLHAPEAPLWLNGQVTTCQAIAESALPPVPACPFPLGDPHLVDFRAETPDRLVAWFSLAEPGREERLYAALGAVQQESGWRIGWCTLAEAIAPWSFAEGHLHTLAEFNFMPGARHWIEAAYHRLRPSDDRPLLVLPDARFGCQGSTACCRHDYQIVLPPSAQALIDALPWDTLHPPLAGTKLETRPDGQLQLKENEEACRFLDENRRCRIHAALGRQPFGPCAVFPFHFAETPDGVTVTASLLCPTARAGLGPKLLERADDLRFRLAQAHVRRTDEYRLAPGFAVDWPYFRSAEAALCVLLAEDRLPLHRRLMMGSRALAAWMSGTPALEASWAEQPLPVVEPGFREALSGFLAKIFKWDRLALKPLADRPIPPLSHARLQDAGRLAAMIRDLHFAKVYAYEYDLVTAHNLGILFYLVALTWQTQVERPLDEEAWRELASLSCHGLLKSLIPEGASADYRQLIGSIAFGQSALALASEAPL